MIALYSIELKQVAKFVKLANVNWYIIITINPKVVYHRSSTRVEKSHVSSPPKYLVHPAGPGINTRTTEAVILIVFPFKVSYFCLCVSSRHKTFRLFRNVVSA